MARICKVLIVENDDDVRHLLDQIIEDEGYRFSSVKTGTEMHEALDKDDYDIAIIDIILPGQERRAQRLKRLPGSHAFMISSSRCRTATKRSLANAA